MAFRGFCIWTLHLFLIVFNCCLSMFKRRHFKISIYFWVSVPLWDELQFTSNPSYITLIWCVWESVVGRVCVCVSERGTAITGQQCLSKQSSGGRRGQLVRECVSSATGVYTGVSWAVHRWSGETDATFSPASGGASHTLPACGSYFIRQSES